MTSLRKIIANRANALKSTGPRTPEGKARSCMNAVKTGLTARTVVLANESHERFQDMLDSMIETYRPESDEEYHCIEEMAAARWATRRAWNVEAAITDLQMDVEAKDLQTQHPNVDESTRLGHAVQSLSDTSRVLHEVHRRLGRSSRLFDRAYAHLQKLQEKRKKQATDVVSQPVNSLSTYQLVSETPAPGSQSRVSGHLLPSSENLPNQENH